VNIFVAGVGNRSVTMKIWGVKLGKGKVIERGKRFLLQRAGL